MDAVPFKTPITDLNIATPGTEASATPIIFAATDSTKVPSAIASGPTTTGTETQTTLPPANTIGSETTVDTVSDVEHAPLSAVAQNQSEMVSFHCLIMLRLFFHFAMLSTAIPHITYFYSCAQFGLIPFVDFF